MTQNPKIEDWGKCLSRFITNTEARVASYKKLVGQAYKNGDQELVTLFKEFRKEEERWLKSLRMEKTDWNAGMWMTCRYS